jgi:hypothetical protein
MMAVLPIVPMMQMASWGFGLAPEEMFAGREPQVTHIVAGKLILDWSPEQISGWLKI